MRLSAKIIKNFQNINSFDFGTEWYVVEGDANSLYFQLVDLDQDSLRYLPTDASYSVSVTFAALNPAETLVKVATQANTLDRSIWKVDIASNETVVTGNVQVALTEGAVIKRFNLISALVVDPLNNGGC